MPTIVVNDFDNVTVDGVASGSVPDVLANFKGVTGIRGDMQTAVQAWRDGREKAHADAVAAKEQAHADALAGKDQAHAEALAARHEEHQAALAAKDAAHADALAAKDAALAEAAAHAEAEAARLRDTIASQQTMLNERQAMIDALGGTELGQQMKREAELARLREQKARIEADLAKLETP